MSLKRVLSLSLLLLSSIAVSGDDTSESLIEEFTGEVLTQLYVTDVRESVSFYKALGFKHDYYYDYKNDTYTRIWDQPYPPEYAEMKQGTIRIAMTTADEPEQVYGGGVRHYFLVFDVDRQYAMAKANGIVPEPDEVEERPWMNFFTVSDPDNHQIVLGQKNQAYYDSARDQLNSLEQ
jgi:predicted lactoylglutathione lyase